MTILPHSMPAMTRPLRWWNAFARYAISVTALFADIVIIVGISLLMGFVYHEAAYGDIGPLHSFVGVGATAAGIFVLPGIFRGEYNLTHYLTFRPHIRRAFTYWHVTIVALLVLGFLTRLTEDYSRGSLVLFYLAGLPAVLTARYALVSTVVLGSQVGLRQFIHPTDDEFVVNEGTLQRLHHALEMALRKAGVTDAGQQILVGQGVEEQECVVVKRARLTRIAADFRLDAIE